MKSQISRIILFIIVTFSLLVQGVAVLATPTVSLDVLDAEIYSGEQFTINVVAHGVTDVDPIIAFGFDLDYDPSWSWNGYSVGLIYDDSALFPTTDVAGSTISGVSGDDIFLASLSFTPYMYGAFNFGISSDLSDPNEGLISLFNFPVDITTSVEVHVLPRASVPIPEPATLFLLGSGLSALLFLRKRDMMRISIV